MLTHMEPNPRGGTVHKFKAYRSKGPGDDKLVTLAKGKR